jgi:hypothetical protein
VRAAYRRHPWALRVYGRLLGRLTSPDQFPSLHAALASGSLDDPDDPDAEFIFGLGRIPDGVVALMTAKEERR